VVPVNARKVVDQVCLVEEPMRHGDLGPVRRPVLMNVREQPLEAAQPGEPLGGQPDLLTEATHELLRRQPEPVRNLRHRDTMVERPGRAGDHRIRSSSHATWSRRTVSITRSMSTGSAAAHSRSRSP
jgi:hypothetical protein